MRLPVLALAAVATVGMMTLCADARAQRRPPNPDGRLRVREVHPSLVPEGMPAGTP
jgi:hypothetical protein